MNMILTKLQVRTSLKNEIKTFLYQQHDETKSKILWTLIFLELTVRNVQV